MAAAPVNPSQQGAPPAAASPAPGPQDQPSQAPASPELMILARFQQALKQVAEQVPAASAGLAKAAAGINEAMSAVVAQPQQQGPSQSPPY